MAKMSHTTQREGATGVSLLPIILDKKEKSNV
jgi:hypothetical protein